MRQEHRNDEVPQEVGEAWITVHVLTSVMRLRPLTAAEQDELHQAHVAIRAKLESAEGEVARLREDARRYRWLRDGGTEELCVRAQGPNPVHTALFAYYRKCSGQLDAAIDAALQEHTP